MACAQTHAAAAQSASETASYHMDLQKSLEVMRFVIMTENTKLKELLQETSANLADLSEKLHARKVSLPLKAPQPAAVTTPSSRELVADVGGSAAREPARVEWCLRNMADVLALGQHDPDSSHSERTAFRLPAFPGLNFELRFYPWAGGAGAKATDAASAWQASAEASREQRRRFELQLDVSGASSSLDLWVALSIDVEGVAEGVAVRAVLSGGGTASCIDSWPIGWPAGAGAAAASVICRAEVEELSWSPGRLGLSTSWQPPSC